MLTIRNLQIFLTKSGKTHPKVNGVGFRVRPKRPLTLMGETGCGKSLIAHAVFHLLPREMTVRGEIYYNNQNLLNCSDQAMRRMWGREIFLFPQEPGTALNPLRRSWSQVMEIFRWVKNAGPNFSHMARRLFNPNGYHHRWKALFKQVGLSIRDGEKFPWQLSGGMSQRLLTVMALAEPARLIVADEPTKGLDSSTRSSTIGLLQKLVNSGKGLFVITHDAMVPRQLGGDLAVMYGGMIMEAGPAKEVLEQPRHPYTRALLNALPENGLHPIPLRVNGNSFKGGCPFSPRCEKAISVCFHQAPPETGDENLRDINPAHCPAGNQEVVREPASIRGDNPYRVVRCHLGCEN